MEPNYSIYTLSDYLHVFNFLRIILVVGVALWAAGDAEKRGKSKGFVFIMVLIGFPVGFLVWLVFRPENIIE